MAWSIRYRGSILTVEPGEAPRESVLTVDDVVVDQQTASYWDRATLHHGDLAVKATWGARNQLVGVALEDGSTQTPFDPPPDSRAGRRAAMARDRPVAFVLRRTALGAAEVVLGFLGVSALLSALPPRVGRPEWLRLPDWWGVPNLPDWLRYLNPGYWLSRIDWPDVTLPDVTVPGWVEAVASTSKYWLPIVIAAAIALGEVERRRRRDADEGESPDDPAAPRS